MWRCRANHNTADTTTSPNRKQVKCIFLFVHFLCIIYQVGSWNHVISVLQSLYRHILAILKECSLYQLISYLLKIDNWMDLIHRSNLFIARQLGPYCWTNNGLSEPLCATASCCWLFSNHITLSTIMLRNCWQCKGLWNSISMTH